MRTWNAATVIGAVTATLTVSLLAAPADSATPSSSVASSLTSAPDTVSTLVNIYNNPTAAYLSATCVINLSSITDFTIVSSITQCGQTITFSPVVEKRSIPASWPSPWGAAVQTEIPNPDVLYTMGSPSLMITFSSPRRIAGFEAAPQFAAVQSFKAEYLDASSLTIGQVNRTISGGKARLLAAKTQASTKVKSIRVSSNGDFAIAQLRLKP